LSAIQLLAGLAGFSLDQELSNEQFAVWNDLKKPDLPLFDALKSNLFHGDGEQLRTPVHRTIAEFLSARYLSLQIEQSGLPMSRTLALMTGEDGGIVPDLRGLAAWLCVHNRSGRSVLIERDPLGVVLYGDVRNFPVEDKESVFSALGSEAERYPWFRSDDWSDSPFGALATKDMESLIRNILTLQSRAEADQSLLNCVLDAISYGEQMPSLAEPLEAIVRESSYWPYIRRNAIQALIHSAQPEHARPLQLAKDIRVGIVEDGDDELIGALLKALYPNDISPSEIFDYLHPPKSSSINNYSMFWRHYLSKQSTDDDLPILLDKLVERQASDEKEPDMSKFDRLEGLLLARAVDVFGDPISDERLYQWLGVVLDKYDFSRIEEAPSKRISAWFETRPNRYKALIEYAAKQCTNQEDASRCMHSALTRISMASPPAGIETWYMDKAVAEQNTEMAQFYFMEAIQPLQIFEGGRRGYLPLSELDRLESWIDANPKCEPWLLQYISCPVADQEHVLRSQKWDIEQQQKKTERITFYHQHIDAIRDGSASPQILHDLALAYNGQLTEARGDSPRERLEDFLGNDGKLIDATFTSFRHTLERSDLPEVSEIIDLALKGNMHYIRPACLIGMDDLFLQNSDEALSLPGEILSRLLLFRLTDGMGDEPQWFESLVKVRPSLVAGAFLAYARPMLRAKKEHIDGLHLITGENAYAEIARLVLPKLLEGFPVRASVKQVSFVLDRLLKGGFCYLSRKDFATLVVRKSSLKSMDAAQKVYWLTCGLLLKPEAYENQLFQFIGNNQKRRAHLAAFIYEGFRRSDFLSGASIPVSVIAHIIELFGPDCQDTYLSGTVTAAMRTADMMRSFINTLANDPGEQSSLEIERLLGLSKLSSWHNQLRHAQHSQRIAQRKASFHRLSVSQVDQSLANLQPSNIADLAALTYEQLRVIARNIRDGSTNDYKQYWSYEEKYQKIINPKSKSENDCRDALLSDLQVLLGKIGIDAQREGSYADDKRADIRISFGGTNGFSVPIEIKKDTHRDLWRSIHEQLIAKYTRDPGADGYGIYLVFWFGGKRMPLPPDGKKLRSAKALEEKLRQQLSSEENHRINICVIDCALPKLVT